QSTDKTATGVHVFHNLGASQYTDAQLTSMAGGGSNAAGTYDRDLFKYGLLDMKNGNHAITVVTFELSYDPALGFAGGGVNVQRFAGIGFTAGGGLGVADLNFNNAYELGDVNLFQTVLESNNTAYNPGGDLNADGLIDETDNVLNVPWLVSRSASAGVINSATQLRLTRAMALDGTMNIPSGTLNVSGVSIPATPLTFTNSFNILAGKTITKTGGQTLNISAPQSHGNKAKLEVAGGVVNMNTNGGTNLTVNTAGAGAATNFTVSQSLTAIGVGSGGVVTLTPSAGVGGGKSIGVTVLNMTGGLLDLTNNNLAVNWTGADPSVFLTSQIALARNEGAWDGPAGITSSAAATTAGLTGLGSGPAEDILGISGAQTVLWAGQTVDGSTLLVKYTYEGDANLDGFISGDDYSTIDFNVGTSASGYSNGDFNYDGIISGDDYSSIDFNYAAQGAPILSSASVALTVAAVPEPSACAFAFLAAAAAAVRRRRVRNSSGLPTIAAMR
ncbi:MAG: hypothetical protein QOE14_129, partial [Humisphaera sp.]|nr:hypothetical protein [Humisphaera sp.]